MKVYDEKKDIANRLVSLARRVYAADLELALSRLAGKHLAWVFDRLSRDLPRYRRGFPDLFVVSGDEPGFELYEVKAPGDQLRPEQRAWIDHLNEGGLPASILRDQLGFVTCRLRRVRIAHRCAVRTLLGLHRPRPATP